MLSKMQSKQTKVDYSKGMIYKICCLDTSIKEVYIGSTTNFTDRKRAHGYNCNNSNNKKYNFNVYRFIRANGGWSNWTMTLIDYHPCTTKLELERGERAVLEQHEATLNKQVPSRGKKEYKKEYYENNKEVRQKIKESGSKRIKCECGCEIRRDNLSKHHRTKKHLDKMIQFNNDSD